MERELLLRAAKSRSKNEDPEQAKLKAKAKEVILIILLVWKLVIINNSFFSSFSRCKG